MATLFLICGLPGSGKTTLARQIEAERPALRLCPDEWIARLLADHSDRAEMDRLRGHVEAIQWQLAKRALALGADVVLEFGFWSRQEREEFRREAAALGAKVVLRYLAVERAELLRRLDARNASLPPGSFHVRRDELEAWWNTFEAPAPEELA